MVISWDPVFRMLTVGREAVGSSVPRFALYVQLLYRCICAEYVRGPNEIGKSSTGMWIKRVVLERPWVSWRGPEKGTKLSRDESLTHNNSKFNAATGGVRPSLVEGRVKGASNPVQKQPQPEGHIGTVTSNDLRHEMWVTCEQLKHVRERPEGVIPLNLEFGWQHINGKINAYL